MKQTRLEALKLAYLADKPVDEILETAEKFAQFIENGAKVVDLPTVAKVVDLPTEAELAQPPKRRRGRSKFNL